MESESRSIDPRYRPEFQRGYAGTAGPVAHGPLPVARSADAPIRIEPLPVAEPEVEGREVADQSASLYAAPNIEPEPTKRRRNPYLWIIPLAGVGFVVLGSWMTIAQTITNYSNQPETARTAETEFWQGLTYAFSSPLITVGLATLFGYVFWLAVRRRRR